MTDQLYSLYFNKEKISIVMVDILQKDIDFLKRKYDDWFCIVVAQGPDKGILIKFIE